MGRTHRETIGSPPPMLDANPPCPTFSQCATNAPCTWSCIRQNHKHMICVWRVRIDVPVSVWLRLVQVFAGFPHGLAFCRVGSDTLMPVGTLERRHVVRGIRPFAAAASCTRDSCSGSRGPAAWVASAIVKKPTFFGVCKMSARSCQLPLRPVTAGERPERAALTEKRGLEKDQVRHMGRRATKARRIS